MVIGELPTFIANPMSVNFDVEARTNMMDLAIKIVDKGMASASTPRADGFHGFESPMRRREGVVVVGECAGWADVDQIHIVVAGGKTAWLHLLGRDGVHVPKWALLSMANLFTHKAQTERAFHALADIKIELGSKRSKFSGGYLAFKYGFFNMGKLVVLMEHAGSLLRAFETIERVALEEKLQIPMSGALYFLRGGGDYHSLSNLG
jgi:hypothetical protein